MYYTVEIRTYTLRSNTRAEFIRVFEACSLPLLERWGVDVVAFGPSLERDDGAYLIRAYANLKHRTQSQDAFYAFYGNSEWHEGPQVAVLSCVESSMDAVLELEESAISQLRWRH